MKEREHLKFGAKDYKLAADMIASLIDREDDYDRRLAMRGALLAVQCTAAGLQVMDAVIVADGHKISIAKK